MRHGCVGFNQKSGWTIALIPQNQRTRHLADFQSTLTNIYQLNFVWYENAVRNAIDYSGRLARSVPEAL